MDLTDEYAMANFLTLIVAERAKGLSVPHAIAP